MKNFMKLKIVLFSVLFVLGGQVTAQQVVLQGFWWDYYNNNYPNDYAGYLADLAPRLSAVGIDGVWIPPTVKGAGTNNVGYAPFDHYDLGDKYQKGSVPTRLGTKDRLLYSIAVMHSNGIKVMQDVVLNHVTNAGSALGNGSDDPEAWNGVWKNFRYSCYETPATDESESNYLAREGRFPKNWQNFHSNPGHNCNSGDLCSDWWGPDVCYYADAYGQSSNAIFNPVQEPSHMRNYTREWMKWYIKQCDFDSYRLDATKHFDEASLEDFLWNVQFGNQWANLGESMVAVGEYVEWDKTKLDQHIARIMYRAGTFDFSIRNNGVKAMISGNGNFNLADIPGTQQSVRYVNTADVKAYRTFPYVNSHDTFRPIVDANGNYSTWDESQELGGHIDPRDGRLSAAYAVIMAVDGVPIVFFEDLFDLNQSNRYTHDPKNPEQLPMRADIANLIWCHNALNFKGGAYYVPHAGADHLVIERGGKAIIGITDSWSSWQSQWVYTHFAPGTQLKDYSEASNHTITVNADGWVEISTPPCDGSANLGRRGYSVWAPVGAAYTPPMLRTEQEWELAQDLGDSHPSSLKQGGALPAASTDWRYVGRITVRAGETINYNVNLENSTVGFVISFFENNGTTVIHNKAGIGTLSGYFTSTCSRNIKVKIRHSDTSTPEQKAWVRLDYVAPKNSTDGYPVGGVPACNNAVSVEDVESNSNSMTIAPNPVNTDDQISIQLQSAEFVGKGKVLIYDVKGSIVMTQFFQIKQGSNFVELNNQLCTGIYNVYVPELNLFQKLVVK